jgi:hypothetical protein
MGVRQRFKTEVSRQTAQQFGYYTFSSPPRLPNGIHPRRCPPSVELEVLLQRIQGLQRREPRLAILAAPEEREQTTSPFRQPAQEHFPQ